MANNDMLQVFLAEQDVPCPNCSYNLRGLKDGVCPECRQQLTLNVALQQPVLKEWLATIIPLWIVGGGAALAMVIVFIIAGDDIYREFARMFRDQRPRSWMIMGILYPMIIAAILAPAAVWLTKAKGRKWFTARANRKDIRNWSICVSAVALVIWTVWLFNEVN